MNTPAKDRGPKNPEWLHHHHAPENEERRKADLDRRLRAAGIAPDDDATEDMNTFRYRLARMIVMFINDWPGCPERICRRMRGCMAPNGPCTNHADDRPMTEEEWDKARFETRRALDAHIESLGGSDAIELRLEQEAQARAAAKASSCPHPEEAAPKPAGRRRAVSKDGAAKASASSFETRARARASG